MGSRLTAVEKIEGQALLPQYRPEEHGVGIAHIGVGAFHRAHQAVMTDDALAQHGGDWRIVGVSLRSTDLATKLNLQNGLYTLLERGQAATTARVIAAIDHVIAADSEAALAMLGRPEIRVVTLTVTEAGYGIDRDNRLPDINNPVVSADLAQPAKATGVLGLLVAALDQRRRSGVAPFTVLSCDNLPENGALVRDGVTGFARNAYDDELAEWIQANVSFPGSMVDRITPASTDDTCQEASGLTGCDDLAAIETEPFSQWIIEDNFPSGRPMWEAGGAIFVNDVTPYERMKLMMLNGSHSMLAYSGFLTNKSYVKEVMQDEHLEVLVQRHFNAAAALLGPLPGVDYRKYAKALSERFSNPAIAHQTFQIASDGTQKLPQRIFQPAIEAQDAGLGVRPFAFTAAMWMRFCLQRRDDGTSYALNDPRASEVAQAVNGIAREGVLLSDAFHILPDLIPKELCKNNTWRECIAEILTVALSDGCIAAVRREAENARKEMQRSTEQI